MTPHGDHHLPCSQARAAIQARLDEPLPTDRETALATHLLECKGCSVYRDDLETMRDTLRSMPPLELPAAVREEVQSAVGKCDTKVERFFRGSVQPWRRPAVAAVLVLAVVGSWWSVRAPDAPYSDAEVAHAAEDLELALALAAGALGEVERVTRQGVMAEQVVPAMRRILAFGSTAEETPSEEGGSSDEQ